MPENKTHFEQIPVNVVKKLIATRESNLKKRSSDPSIFETRATKTEPYGIAVPAFCERELLSEDAPMESGLDGFMYPEWQKPYRDALVELDKGKLKVRITAAEAVMLRRLREITGSAHDHERQAIEDAMGMLRALKQTELSG
jgi:hypothetical protein